MNPPTPSPTHSFLRLALSLFDALLADLREKERRALESQLQQLELEDSIRRDDIGAAAAGAAGAAGAGGGLDDSFDFTPDAVRVIVCVRVPKHTHDMKCEVAGCVM